MTEQRKVGSTSTEGEGEGAVQSEQPMVIEPVPSITQEPPKDPQQVYVDPGWGYSKIAAVLPVTGSAIPDWGHSEIREAPTVGAAQSPEARISERTESA